jgi:hypothetical protein
MTGLAPELDNQDQRDTVRGGNAVERGGNAAGTLALTR